MPQREAPYAKLGSTSRTHVVYEASIHLTGPSDQSRVNLGPYNYNATVRLCRPVPEDRAVNSQTMGQVAQRFEEDVINGRDVEGEKLRDHQTAFDRQAQGLPCLSTGAIA